MSPVTLVAAMLLALPPVPAPPPASTPPPASPAPGFTYPVHPPHGPLPDPAGAPAPRVDPGPAPRTTPVFSAPFPCGQRWTYTHHSDEVRLALDFVRADGGATAGAPVLASAPGTATRHAQPGGAGNYIVIDHGGGWQTYYFHLDSYLVESGAAVTTGQPVGTTGSTGNSSGPHLHYEQLHLGVGQLIQINGSSLAPYPTSYGLADITSDTACGPGAPFMTWGTSVRVREQPHTTAPVLVTLTVPTLVYVLCQVQGDVVSAEGYTNAWWSKVRDQNGYLSNIFIDHPDAKLAGVPECPP